MKETTENIGYAITDEDMLLLNLLDEIEKEDDEESFNIFKEVVAKKNSLLYYPLNEYSKVGFDGLFPNINTTDEAMSVNDLVTHAIANEELIIGYTTLSSKKFKGFISQIGTITGTNLSGKNIKDIPIYNKVPTKVIGILPIRQEDENGQQITKYLLVCSNNTFMDLLYKTIFVGTFIGIAAYKFYSFIAETIQNFN